jgi:hypothetical protein
MSVQRFLPPNHPDGWYANSFKDEPCFYCGRNLSSPFVLWAGFGAELVLHPTCVVELTIRVFRDVHEIECENHSYITSRTLPELRERLIGEEQRS